MVGAITGAVGSAVPITVDPLLPALLSNGDVPSLAQNDGQTLVVAPQTGSQWLLHQNR